MDANPGKQLGSCLEGLTISDKTQIQMTLAVYIWRAGLDTKASWHRAIDETPIKVYSDTAFKAIERLEGISQDDAQDLLAAIATQIAYD